MIASSPPTIALDSSLASGLLEPPDLPVTERRAHGRALRAQTSRRSHARSTPPLDRPDPVGLLVEEAANRVPELMAIRYGRIWPPRLLSCIVLLTGRDDEDRLFLQIKQADRSVLETHLPPSQYANCGQRVVAGQRLMQAASDILLGWQRGSDGHDYYWRQLRDMKGGANVAAMTPSMFRTYAAVCGWTLARGNARSGDRVQIAAYLGRSDQFDRAIVEFSTAYFSRGSNHEHRRHVSDQYHPSPVKSTAHCSRSNPSGRVRPRTRD
jgi:Uncharacterized protein conserved in bacteria (DUF2252)